VRVLAPTVEVDVDGKPVTLSDAQAKLLLALVVAHPAPLHVERASDVLWPDEMLAVTRSRLNSLVHRLRRVLHPYGEAIGRSGDLLVLDGERCRVDLWWFQRALAGDADTRRRALLSVRGNLGDTQFPYEEGFFDERHRLSGDWVRHACRAHKTGEVAIADLEPALTSLKLSSDDLELHLT
jgi:DNA-binding SARP family transcriptional activator